MSSFHGIRVLTKLSNEKKLANLGLELMHKNKDASDKSNAVPLPYIISSKFTPPKSPAALIPRFTTTVVLKELGVKNLVLITAPAGYGKTAMLSQIRSELSKSEKKVAWLSLDENDQRVSQFVTYLVKSLNFVGIPVGDAALAAYQNPTETPLEDFRNSFINEVHAFKTPIVIMLDDLHQVKNEGTIKLIDDLINYAPPNLHIVIASRHEPALSTSRYRIHGSVIEINSRELKFSYEESHSFIHQILELSEDNYSLSRRLYEFTDGWVGALQLALISVKNSQDIDRLFESYEDSKVQLAEFLYTDVLSALPDDLIHFLLKTSILSYMNAELCAMVSGFANSEELLGKIKQLNLFLLPVEGRETWFTYHPRFREFLQEKLLKLPDVDVQELNGKASEWYESENLIADALQHALNGSDNARALKLLEKEAYSFVSEGEFQAIIEWHEILNPPLVESCPNFWIATAYSLMLCFRIPESQEMIRKIKKSMVYKDDLLEFRLSIIDLTIAMYEDDCKKIFSLYDKWPKVLPFQDPLFVPASLNPVSIAFAQTGELQKARDIYNYLTPISEQDRGFMPTTYQQCYLAHAYFQEGRISIAEICCRDRLALAEIRLGHFSVASCCCSAFLSEISYEKNELRELFVVLSERLKIIRENLTPDGIIKPYISLAKAHQYNGEFEKALYYTSELYSIGQKNSQRRFIINALGVKVRIYLRMDDILAAQETLIQLEDIVSSENLKPGLVAEEYIICALSRVDIQFYRGDHSAAFNELTIIKATKIYPRQHTLSVKIDALLCVCKSHIEAKDAALPDVFKVLKEGEKIGLVRTFLDESAFMECVQFHSTEILSNDNYKCIRKYLLDLLDHYLVQYDTQEEFPQEKNSTQTLFTDREKNILDLIAQGLSNKVVASELSVSVDTVKYHLKKIYVKTNTSSRTEAILFAQKTGLIEA